MKRLTMKPPMAAKHRTADWHKRYIDKPVGRRAPAFSHIIQTASSYFRSYRTGLFSISVLLAVLSLPVQATADISVARQAVLRNMLKQDCGSCHGLTLKGGLGPALTVTAISGKPRQLLETTILDGRAGTPMPPFRGLLTEEEVSWLVDLLYRGGD